MDAHTMIIKDRYFKVIRETEDYIEMMSRNTGHCWAIRYCDRKEDYPYLLFHKHAMSIPYYHKHWQTTSFNRAVKSIKSHDDYVLSQCRNHPKNKKRRKKEKVSMKIRKSKIVLNSKRRATLVDEFCRTYSGTKNLTTPNKIVKVMDDVFRLSKQAEEYVYIICMTSKCKPICFFEVSHGSQTKSIAEPGAILTRVLLCGAPDFIMVHNHPSGDPEPSEDDIKISERIRDAALLVGVNMADHIIIGNGEYFSFNEMKRLFQAMSKAKKLQSEKAAE